MADCIIFDIDGTLANLDHRLHHIQGDVKDWDAFHAACGDDEPIAAMRTVFQAVLHSGVEVVIVTGRMRRNESDTLRWLVRHGFMPGELYCQIYMRADGDHRADVIVKQELLADLRRAGLNPIIAFEDRGRVVDMWRRNGIPCAQVAPGNY